MNPPEPDYPGPDDDCVSCGACCFSVGENRVWVNATDAERLGIEAMRTLGEVLGGEFFLRVKENGSCLALTLQEGKTWVCSVYERRPFLCREFEQGSEDCGDARTRWLPIAREAADSGE